MSAKCEKQLHETRDSMSCDGVLKKSSFSKCLSATFQATKNLAACVVGVKDD
jgi:hypothetical protein